MPEFGLGSQHEDPNRVILTNFEFSKDTPEASHEAFLYNAFIEYRFGKHKVSAV